jgi:membrane fusion protein (multidrug efflux system)
MKRILIIIGALIVVGLLAIPKYRSLTKASAIQKNSANPEAPLAVEAYVVEPDVIEDQIFTTGTLLANEEVELVSETSGLIQEIYLNEGREVKKGDLLIKINDSELQAQLRRADFRLNLAEDREKRQKQLLEQGGISQEEYDATLNEVNVLRAEVALINAQIDKTEIRTPFTGRLGLKYVSDGSYISPSTKIATLQDIHRIKIDFSVPERYATMIKVGKGVRFSVQGLDDTLNAKVYAKEPRIDTDTRTLKVRALSDNTEEKLLPGAFADLQLTLNTIGDALMVPTVALVPEINGQKVFLVKNGVVQPQSVTTGIRQPLKVQILQGIAPGDTVLTTGLLQVRPGMPVNIVNISRD